MQRVGLNAVFLEPRMGGVETYVRRLVPALLEVRPELRLSVFVNEIGRETLAAEGWPDEIELITHPLLGRRYTRALTETTLLGWLASRRRLDVLHSVAFIAPLRTRPANVVTIPDMIWRHQPDPAERRAMLVWGIVVPPVARRADRVITYSEASRREIVEDLRIPADRVDVVHLGHGAEHRVDATPEAALRERLGLGRGPIVLAVSALKVHKNLVNLVHAIARVRETVPSVVLVVPGNPTPHRVELEREAQKAGVDGAVVFPGWVSASDLEGLYQCASCFAFPSFREGFGLPVLEAMRHGLPVACANASALPEVAGDAALYFDPHRPEEVAAAIQRLIEDSELARLLSERGRKRQRLFTWRRSAEQTLRSYERACVAAYERRR